LALRRTVEGLSAAGFPQELGDLINYFTGEQPGPITATPGRGDMPAIWLLGSMVSVPNSLPERTKGDELVPHDDLRHRGPGAFVRVDRREGGRRPAPRTLTPLARQEFS
jgi:hypothetical protein